MLTAEARTTGPTGVEMEALTAASVAALTVYDMVKGVERGAEIGPVALLEKSGGRSGEWRRAETGRRSRVHVSSRRMKTAILTISTSVAAGRDEDLSGAWLEAATAAGGREVVARDVLPDDQQAIEQWLRRHAGGDVSLIFTTGGTGLTPDDVTPEATRAVIDRDAPGFAEAMRAESLKYTPMGILTRGVSGIAGRTLIVNFPGNPKAIGQLFPVIAPTLGTSSRRSSANGGRGGAGADTRPVADTPAIELRGLTRHFGERTALRDVSVAVPAGATLAVLGRNGAGKSTLLRILATLLRPHGGELSLFGEPLPRRAFAVRGRLGLLAHEPLLYRDLTARENLRYHASLHGVGRDRVEEVLGAVGMEGYADEPVRLLSRGMVQRIAVCRAVLHRPALLLLDEPRANLDPAAAELVEPLIGRASGCTRVLTSHDPQAALAEADLVLGLKAGRAADRRRAGQGQRCPARGALP